MGIGEKKWESAIQLSFKIRKRMPKMMCAPQMTARLDLLTS